MTKRNHFQEWATNIFQPCCIVYSSKKAKDIIAKNNLSPGEFLRPFGDFLEKQNLTSPLSENLIKPFKLDFIDKESFYAIPSDTYHIYIHSLIKHPNIYPKWKIEKILNPKKNIDKIIKYNQSSRSFPWCNEFEKTIFELLKCQKTEMYQQPLANIYMCSIEDDISIIINQLDTIDNMPKLIKDETYISPETKLIILLIDHLNELNDIDEKVKRFKQKYNDSYSIISFDINTGINVNNNDMWRKYKYNIDLYSDKHSVKNTTNNLKQITFVQPTVVNSINSKLNTSEEIIKVNNNKVNITYGKYISNKEIENNKNAIYNFLINDIYKNISITVNKYNKELVAKNQSFFTFFTNREDKAEMDNEGIYKLNKIEKYLFYLGTIHFYFKNYIKAIDYFAQLLKKLKTKSPIHSLFITELKEICSILEGETLNGDNFNNDLFKQYLENGFFFQALRFLIITIKLFERKIAFNKSNKSLNYVQLYQKYLKRKGIPQTENNSETFLFNVYKAMIWEKKAIFSLLENHSENFINKRSFAMKLFRSAIDYELLSQESHPYLLHSYGNVISILHSKSPSFFETNPNILSSFYLIKEKAYGNLPKICYDMKYYEESFIFSKLNLELSANVLNSITISEEKKADNPFIMNYYIDSLKEIKKNDNKTMKVINMKDISSFNIVDIDNPSLYVIENQDEEISLRLHKNTINWEDYFKQYAVMDYKQRYSIIDEKDISVLKYLDNVTIKNNPSFNVFHKKKFIGNLNEKLYICFNISNKLNMDIFISSIKLIYQVISKDNSDENIDNNTFIQHTSKKVTLKGKETKEIILSITSQCPCVISILGLELILFKYIILEHFFRNKSENYLYYNFNKQNKDNIIRHCNSVSSKESTSKQSSDMNVNMGTENETKRRKNSLYIHKHVLQTNRDKQILYELISKENNIYISCPLGDKINCYRYQCMLYPIIIENNTNIYKIKKFTLFLYNSNCTKNPVLLTLKPYYTFNIRLNQTNKKTTIYIPIYSTEIGNVDVKVVVKFKDEKKRQYIEIKRFSFQVFVQPSFEFSASKSVKMVKEVEEIYKDAFVDFLVSIKSTNLDSLNGLVMKEVFLGKNINLINNDNLNDLDDWNYKLTDNKCYRNLSLVIRYENKRNTCSQDKPLKGMKKHSIKQKPFTDEIDPDDPHLNEYLINKQNPNEVNSIYPQLLKGFIEKKPKIVLSWICNQNIHNNEEIINNNDNNKNELDKLEGFFIFDISELQKVAKTEKINILTPIKRTLNIKINQSFLQTIIENICIVTPSIIKSNNKSFISLKVLLNTHVLNTFTEIKTYDIFIKMENNHQSTFNVNWFGITKYSLLNKTHIKPLTLNFICETKLKGIIPLNYIGIIFKFNSKKNEYLSQIVFKPKYVEINIQN